jgi:hypothetical protein
VKASAASRRVSLQYDSWTTRDRGGLVARRPGGGATADSETPAAAPGHTATTGVKEAQPRSALTCLHDERTMRATAGGSAWRGRGGGRIEDMKSTAPSYAARSRKRKTGAVPTSLRPIGSQGGLAEAYHHTVLLLTRWLVTGEGVARRRVGPNGAGAAPNRTAAGVQPRSGSTVPS